MSFDCPKIGPSVIHKSIAEDKIETPRINSKPGNFGIFCWGSLQARKSFRIKTKKSDETVIVLRHQLIRVNQLWKLFWAQLRLKTSLIEFVCQKQSSWTRKKKLNCLFTHIHPPSEVNLSPLRCLRARLLFYSENQLRRETVFYKHQIIIWCEAMFIQRISRRKKCCF